MLLCSRWQIYPLFTGCDGKRLFYCTVPVSGETLSHTWSLVLQENCSDGNTWSWLLASFSIVGKCLCSYWKVEYFSLVHICYFASFACHSYDPISFRYAISSTKILLLASLCSTSRPSLDFLDNLCMTIGIWYYSMLCSLHCRSFHLEYSSKTFLLKCAYRLDLKLCSFFWCLLCFYWSEREI